VGAHRNRLPVLPSLLPALLASCLTLPCLPLRAAEPKAPPIGAPGSLLARGTDGTAAFDAALYNPAILRIGFSEAKGKTVNAGADAFLDITLIPADGGGHGARSEVSLRRLNELLRKLYGQVASQAPLEVSDPNSASRQLSAILI